MQIAKNRTTAALIALFLMLAMAVSIVALPAANAQSTKVTYAYIGATPNPIGVGQQTLLHLGITDPIGGVRDGWEGLTVTVTRPDGTTETLGPFRTDSTGGTGTVYVPSKVGNYTLQTHFPQQIYQNITRLASDSEKLTLVVQEEPIKFYPGMPLPTEYWTRPIDPQLREWYTVAGNWLVSYLDNLWADPGNDEAPDTAHILWTKPLITGGLVGGTFGLLGSGATSVGFETGDAYQGKWGSRFIIAGVLIYTHHTSVRPLEYTAVDLHTGEVLWTKTFLDNRTISMCQLFYWQSYNYMGTYAYLWVTGPGPGTNWYAFDPFDGNLRLTIYNVPSGTTVVGERGDIYRYSISLSQRTMVVWNLSALISMDGSFTGPGNSTYNASARTASGALTTAAQRAYALNITIPEGLPGSVQAIFHKDRVIGASATTTAVRVWGFSLEPGSEGRLLFNHTWTPPTYWATGNVTVSGFSGGWTDWSQQSKVGVLWLKETREHYGFSLETGDYMWGPTEPQYYLDSIDDSAADVRNIAYDKLYSASVSGIVYCYDVKTGKRLWTYEANDPYTEILWANNWWLKPLFICDGKIYVAHTEHSANQPLPRGAPCICLNATTGEEIWRINGAFRTTRWGGRAIIGDSIMATMDTYDQRVYAVGRGPSATTVEAPMTAITAGNGVVIQGTVTDISPGTEDYARTARFPSGVPAVSDASMSDWMLYVYKQFPRPANATGVTVTLDAVDPNNNWIHIGTATSDSSGLFNYAWTTPDVPGKYTVIATFPGSGAYYASYAETAMYVSEVPPTTPPPQYPVPADYTWTIIGTGIAIIIAVAIVGILMLRKRA